MSPLIRQVEKDMGVTILNGPSRALLAEIPDQSVHAAVTSLIGRLGEHADATPTADLLSDLVGGWLSGDESLLDEEPANVPPSPPMWREVLRILAPGGTLLAVTEPSVYDLTALSVRLAGFQVRDCLLWAGPERHLPILMARKPPVGTLVENVLTHRAGVINIEGCRVAATDKPKFPVGIVSETERVFGGGSGRYADRARTDDANPTGRWPANIVLSHTGDCERVGLREDTYGGGARASGGFANGYARGDGFAATVTVVDVWSCAAGCPVEALDEQGEAVPTSTKPRKTRFLSLFSPEEELSTGKQQQGGTSRFFTVTEWDPVTPATNMETSKMEMPTAVTSAAGTPLLPLSLTSWMVRLVTPPQGTIVDPFAATTDIVDGARAEGCDIIAIAPAPSDPFAKAFS